MELRRRNGDLWFTDMVRSLGRIDDWILMSTICVTGPRDLPEERFYEVEDILEVWDFERGGIDFLGVGDARGVDEAVRGWMKIQLHESQYEVFYADWKRFGKGAGAIRNREMLQRVNPDLLLAFLIPGFPCRGTWDCIEAAMQLDIRIYPYRIQL